MVNSIKLCGVIQMFEVDSFSHKVYRIVDLWLILVFFFKKSDIDRIFGVTLVSAKTRAVPTGESKFRAKTDVERISWSPLSCQSIAVCCCCLSSSSTFKCFRQAKSDAIDVQGVKGKYTESGKKVRRLRV